MFSQEPHTNRPIKSRPLQTSSIQMPDVKNPIGYESSTRSKHQREIDPKLENVYTPTTSRVRNATYPIRLSTTLVEYPSNEYSEYTLFKRIVSECQYIYTGNLLNCIGSVITLWQWEEYDPGPDYNGPINYPVDEIFDIDNPTWDISKKTSKPKTLEDGEIISSSSTNDIDTEIQQIKQKIFIRKPSTLSDVMNSIYKSNPKHIDDGSDRWLVSYIQRTKFTFLELTTMLPRVISKIVSLDVNIDLSNVIRVPGNRFKKIKTDRWKLINSISSTSLNNVDLACLFYIISDKLELNQTRGKPYKSGKLHSSIIRAYKLKPDLDSFMKAFYVMDVPRLELYNTLKIIAIKIFNIHSEEDHESIEIQGGANLFIYMNRFTKMPTRWSR